MSNTLLFATFDPLAENVTICTTCKTHLPIFRYELHADDEQGEAYHVKGFCCENCAAHLLKALECTESAEWAEQEAALADKHRDTSKLHEQLASLRTVLIS